MQPVENDELKELLVKGWMTHDAMWFYHSLQEFGIEKTNKINKAAIRDMSAIEIKRKRGDYAGTITVAGNHAPDFNIGFAFDDCVFQLNEGAEAIDRLPPDEEKTLAVLADYPEGCTPTVVGLAMGKSDNAARASLNRLIARGRVCKTARGIYALASL